MPSASRHVTPDLENDHSMATPKPKPRRSPVPRESMSNITNSTISSKRILAAHLREPSANLKSSSAKDRLSGASAASETPIRAPHAVRRSNASAAATPVGRRQRTDTEPPSVTPRVKTFTDRVADLRKLHSVNDLARLAPNASSSASFAAADIEPIKAFLRIRPPPEEVNRESAQPYIEVVSDTEVLMHPPTQTAYSSSRPGIRARLNSNAPPTKYIFSKVFGGPKATAEQAEQASQSNFFRQTTLPLVDELLQGQSGLIFTYGVTNSGKSHTVMGNDAPGAAGILPRALDVIFNSIKGLESSSDIQPCGVSGIQRADNTARLATSASTVGINPFMIPGLSKKLLGDAISRSLKASQQQREHDATAVQVDRNLRYSVFVSYVEIYNEKLFDLLDASPGSTLGRSESVRGSNWSLAAMANAAPDSLPTSTSITLNRRPLTLKNDTENGGKYVSGLREIKVNSAEEARDLLHRGQENRAVFGTMANRASSRSHGVFTIKVVREHAGASGRDEDLSSIFSTARLSIVDLAGSERVANTGLTSGDRLKEAGNINKSLMCLGQCLETLRKNQIRLVGAGDGSQAHTVKRRMSIVPFRHSKLTELFQSFFTGEGKAVMIVNANPYDTGFDENSHVMKFSAIAKEVATARPQAVVTKTLPVLARSKTGGKDAALHSDSSRLTDLSSIRDSETEADITIIEDDEDSEPEESDPFVDMLVEKHEELRQKLYAAEMRCASIEAQVREEMANEMEQRLLEMQELYNQRMMSDAEQNEHFMNRKIDLLVRTNARLESNEASDTEGSDVLDSDVEGSTEGCDEAEIDQSLAQLHIAEISRADTSRTTAFDSATEGEDYEDDVDESGDGEASVLLTGRSNRMRSVPAVLDESRDDGSDQEDDDDDDDGSRDEVEVQESAEGLESETESRADSDDDDAEDEDEDEEAESGVDESLGSAITGGSDAADSSFDITAASGNASESEEEAPPPRAKASRRSTINKAAQEKPSRGSASTARGRRSSRASVATSRGEASVLVEAPALTDISDASMIAEETISPKKKRKLRKKAAVQEDDYVEQIGDSSLVEAVFQSTSGNTSRSFGSRKSMR
ncbi:kinesin-domain-containing protein [Testicularia cyperi]|uniref:Kinesin-domain-containing protein n=1 Tax=Testicularia cyperi TaxID=1882483 RepID=A0A317XFD6_9BASI|nr:kinesin-domain-containing protein [Testicularia cyperi]